MFVFDITENYGTNLSFERLCISRVNIDLVIKVGDFGLSRDIYMINYYRMPSIRVCPVKWMPPEMIRDGICTEKSDVVSFFNLFR